MTTSELQLDLGDMTVDAVLERPADARAVYVLAHGAGAGMRHGFLETLAGELAKRRIATLRYQFPYMQLGSRRPDRPPRLRATIRAAVAEAGRHELPIVAGGKSMGGRLTAYAAADGDLESVRGLVLLGFPLHPAGKPGSERWQSMRALRTPSLFVQGDRDALGGLDLLRPLVAEFDGATLHVVDGGDHSFAVLKRSGRRPEEVVAEICDTAAQWIEGCIARPQPVPIAKGER